MAVQSINISIDQGTDFLQYFSLYNSQMQPLDLTGYTGSASLKKHYSSLSSNQNFIVKFGDRKKGQIFLEMRSSATRTINPGRYVYDVVISDANGLKSRVIEGSVLVNESISIDYSPSYPSNFGGIPFAPQNTTSEYLNSLGTNWNIIKNISLDEINGFGVVLFGYFNTCGSLENLVNYFDDPTNLNELNYYLLNGGVIWFRAEAHNSCGDTERSNIFLEKLGSSMRISNIDTNTITSGLNPATSTLQLNNNLFPQTLQVRQTSAILNGTAIYKINDYTTFAYEKVNGGLIIVNGDADTFFGVEGPNQNFYDAIRSLV